MAGLLAAALLFVFAPLMIYFVYARLGETNDLLRHLIAQTHLMPLPPSPPPPAFPDPDLGDHPIAPPAFQFLSR